MNPLICFYKDQWILSENYLRIEKPFNVSAFDFLKQIEKDYFQQIKIIQVDFEAFQSTNSEKTNYYQSPSVQVFVINGFKSFQPDSTAKGNDHLQFEALISKKMFCEQVQKIIADINKGRFYQVNLTAAFSAAASETTISTFEIFNNYLSAFKPTYPALLPGKNFDILSYSPELFLFKKNDIVISRPIKGTSTDGYEKLLNNPKEAAELSMIVDLLRNDLNSLATTPAVVTAHRKKLELPYTTHTFSEIKITTNETLPTILQKTMPGGSISGCPKIESLKAIAEHENYNRQFYTGTIGWWEQNDFELNIAIRSFVRTREQIFYFAGCGIVSESDPEAEWNELLNKASKLKLKQKK